MIAHWRLDERHHSPSVPPRQIGGWNSDELAAHFGGKVFQQVSVIDLNVQWNKIGNIRHNAGIRTVLYQLTRPLRALWRAPAKR